MNLELNARTKAKVLDIPLKLSEKKEEPNWAVHFGINATHDQLGKMVGDRVAQAIFSSFVASEDNGDGNGTWVLKKPRPATRCELHKITIDGGPAISTEPMIKHFETLKDTEKVRMVVAVRIGKAQIALLMKLIKKQGSECEFEIVPSLQNLPLGDSPAMNLSEQPKIVKKSKQAN